jgi:hypothetical protein
MTEFPNHEVPTAPCGVCKDCKRAARREQRRERVLTGLVLGGCAAFVGVVHVLTRDAQPGARAAEPMLGVAAARTRRAEDPVSTTSARATAPASAPRPSMATRSVMPREAAPTWRPQSAATQKAAWRVPYFYMVVRDTWTTQRRVRGGASTSLGPTGSSFGTAAAGFPQQGMRPTFRSTPGHMESAHHAADQWFFGWSDGKLLDGSGENLGSWSWLRNPTEIEVQLAGTVRRDWALATAIRQATARVIRLDGKSFDLREYRIAPETCRALPRRIRRTPKAEHSSTSLGLGRSLRLA